MAEPAEQEDPLHTPRAESLRRTLTAYYTTHGPENLPNVEALVGRVVGGPPSEVGGMVVGGVLWSEEELFEKIEAKYGVKVQIRRGRNYPPALSASVIFHKDSPYSAEWGEAEWPYDSFRSRLRWWSSRDRTPAMEFAGAVAAMAGVRRASAD